MIDGDVANTHRRPRRFFTLALIAVVALALAVFAQHGAAGPAVGAPAPDGNSVLILASSVSGGAGSAEATTAAAQGFTVEVASDADWAAKSTSDFASYQAIILGDAYCTSIGAIAAAEANRAVWGPAITGNVVIIGTDPVYHSGQGGAAVTQNGIAFATADDTTGAYITLSCYYGGAAPGTPVPVLEPFGAFTLEGARFCGSPVHIVASHPALAGLTDADLSFWGCSVHENFDTWPANFLPLAIALDGPPTYTAPDGSVGAPYILAKGEGLVPIGSGLDHFRCYEAGRRDVQGFAPRTVYLEDQFEAKNTRVVGPLSFCNPVEKTVDETTVTISNPEAHLACYSIVDVRGQSRFTPRDVLVNNQFGDQTLTVKRARALCVPSLKDGDGEAAAPDNLVAGLGHFKCYDAKLKPRGEFAPVNVHLKDQFQEKDTVVITPRLLCNPVSKDGEEIVNESGHLVCYVTKDIPRQRELEPRVIDVENQFGEQRWTTWESRMLCVPSTKEEPD